MQLRGRHRIHITLLHAKSRFTSQNTSLDPMMEFYQFPLKNQSKTPCTAGVGCQWPVVSRKKRSNVYLEPEMSCIPTGFFVNPEIIPVRNGPRATNNGRGVFAENCYRKNLDSRSAFPFSGCRAECCTGSVLGKSPLTSGYEDQPEAIFSRAFRLRMMILFPSTRIIL